MEVFCGKTAKKPMDLGDSLEKNQINHVFVQPLEIRTVALLSVDGSEIREKTTWDV